MSKRRKFTDYEKKTVYAKCNGRCYLCGQPIDFKDLTIDHEVPLHRGGTNEFSNLQLACHRCNCAKGYMTLEELLETICQIVKYNKRETIMLCIKHTFIKGGIAR